MPERIRISVDNGKYTYVMREDGSTFALRYGQPWIDSMTNVPSNGMILAFAHELEEAREKITNLTENEAGITLRVREEIAEWHVNQANQLELNADIFDQQRLLQQAARARQQAAIHKESAHAIRSLK